MIALRLALAPALAAALLFGGSARAAGDPVSNEMVAAMLACEAAHGGADLSAYIRQAGYEEDGEGQWGKTIGDVDLILARDRSTSGSLSLEYCTIGATTRSVDRAQLLARIRARAPAMGLETQPVRTTDNGGEVTPFENTNSADIVSYSLVIFAPDAEFAAGYASVNLIWRPR